ncbi:MAG TPA: hypothetical protein VIY48_02495 [Candidatus Paceibacterota bacterium]|jgi:hypothetical protein
MTDVLEIGTVPIPDADLPPDLPPETGSDLRCQVCGTELVYGGRGRKPTRCDEHKKQSGGNKRQSQSNDKLAAQATDSLMALNALATMGIMFAGMNRTASAIAERDDAFREQAYSALLTDPALCRVILRGGAVSARLSLGIAYATLGAAVAPVAIAEFKEKRNGRG